MVPGFGQCVALTRDGTRCSFGGSHKVTMRGKMHVVCGSHHALWDEVYAFEGAEQAARRILDGIGSDDE